MLFHLFYSDCTQSDLYWLVRLAPSIFNFRMRLGQQIVDDQPIQNGLTRSRGSITLRSVYVSEPLEEKKSWRKYHISLRQYELGEFFRHRELLFLPRLLSVEEFLRYLTNYLISKSLGERLNCAARLRILHEDSSL